MRTKVTLVLIFLNVALFYFIFFLRPGLDIKPDATNILGPEVSNIQSIAITNAAGETLTRVERRGDKWLLAQPVSWPANELAIRSIISELQFLRPASTFKVDEIQQSDRSLASYGLEKPPYTLTFTPAATSGSPAPQPVAVRIGKPTPDGSRLYILSPDGQNIHVVHRSLAESLSRTLQSLRSDELFTIPVFEARSLNLEPAGSSRVRFRRENDRWFIEGLSATQTRASKANTIDAIGRLRELRVHSFIKPSDGEAARNDLATPSLRVTVEGNNRRETLLLGKPVPAEPAATSPEATPAAETPAEPATVYFAMMEGEETGGTNPARATLFTVSVPDRFRETLLNAQRELREKQILDASPTAITSITLSSPQASEEVVLQRPDARNLWQIVRRTESGLQTSPVERAIVDRLIGDLLKLSAEPGENIPAFIDVPSEAQKESFGFNRPARVITLTTEGTPAPAPTRLLIGSSQTRQTYALISGQETVFHISDEILRQTPVDPLYYRDRNLRELPASTAITALKLTDLSNDTVLLDTALPLPADTKLDRAAVEALVAPLRNLRAKNIVATTFTKTVFTAGEERGWKYRLDASLTPAGPEATPTTSTLFFADRAGGDIQLAGSSDPGLNLVFEVEQPLLDALFKLTYGPRDPGPTPTPPPPATTPAP